MQGSEGEGHERIALVTPAGSVDGSESFRHLSSLLRVNEIHLICATLSGQLEPSILVLPPGKTCTILSKSSGPQLT